MSIAAATPRHRTRSLSPRTAGSRSGPESSNAVARVGIEHRPLTELKPHPKTLRKHSERQIELIAAGIREFGFLSPVVIDAEGTVIAGHARLDAAKLAGLTEIPVVLASHLSPAQARAFRLADNKLSELAEWDPELLRIELTDLSSFELDFNVELTGFSTAEIDLIVESGDLDKTEPAEELPALRDTAVTRPGDLWQLGAHLLLCGDARESASYAQLLSGRKARLVITDAPYNVQILGHASGLGRVQHAEFAMASGEMNSGEFQAFLATAFKQLAANSLDGSLHYLFMDHRHIEEMVLAGACAYDSRLNVLVWAKTNAGMGSLYRSRHELIFVYKHGKAPHVNNVELGANGRYRTNVLEYAGANTFRSGRDEELARHPTPKPVLLIADLIRDASKVGDLVLDCFAGGGTIFIAAEKTRRRAAAIEIDPVYCDLSIERWQKATGKAAVLVATGETFDTLAQTRRQSTEAAALVADGARHGD